MPTNNTATGAFSGNAVLQSQVDVTDAGLALFHESPVFKTWSGRKAEMSLMAFRAQSNYLWLNLKAPLTNAGLASPAGLPDSAH